MCHFFRELINDLVPVVDNEGLPAWRKSGAQDAVVPAVCRDGLGVDFRDSLSDFLIFRHNFPRFSVDFFTGGLVTYATICDAGSQMIAEYGKTEDGISYSCSDDYCSATIIDEERCRCLAVAEMNTLGNPFEWWVARVLVPDRKNRGNGYGSSVLRQALQLVEKRTMGIGKVVVAPGGYDNDQQRQFGFYRKNGFVQVNPEGLFEWRSNSYRQEASNGKAEEVDDGQEGYEIQDDRSQG